MESREEITSWYLTVNETELKLLKKCTAHTGLRTTGYINSCHIREINRALAVSVGLMEEMPENLIMCLCPTCANNFYGTGSYFLRRISADDSEKDICTYCGQRRGFDYEVVQRPKDNEKE